MAGRRIASLVAALVLVAALSFVATLLPTAAPLLLAPAAASAAPSNAASTHTFLLADYSLAQASEQRVPVAQRKAKEREHRLLRECHHAAAGSPQNEQSYDLSYEAAGALWSASYRADAGPIATFVHTTHGLRWSNAATTREVKRYIAGLSGLSHLPMPHVCADIAAWKASGFAHLPPATVSFDAYLEALEANPVPSRLLSPYAQPADRQLLARTQRIETKLLNSETVLGSGDWYGLTEGLELTP